ncbi:surfeit locus protein 6 [Sorex araneus]|uniref:surfeit locus protein 6 n=1 Tax=Sorex araneus TaxID=42254 RepID=UPI002433E85A|nr:surfeit locus protein 6 [Sorex araneus]
MASLLAKDAYLQGLARRICARPGPEPRERRRAAKTRAAGAAGAPPKKRKRAHKSRQRSEKAARPEVPAPGQESPATPGARTAAAAQRDASRSAGAPAGGTASEPESLFALDVLRQRLHEKIQQARGQDQKELSAAALEKRRRRKQERERKKRKRKELRAGEKEKAAEGPQAAAEAGAPPPAPDAPGPEAQGGSGLLFNKVEVRSDEPRSKAQRRRERRARLKGNLTPLTGRNYRQLLERLQARRERVEELREQDAGRAQELQARMQWTNLLYKAEGVKIRDDEQRLQEALKRKQRRRAQRERAWQGRTARVVQGMQQRQERRRQSLRRRKAARAARRLDKARKKGRVLPQDLERAGLVD